MLSCPTGCAGGPVRNTRDLEFLCILQQTVDELFAFLQLQDLR